MPAVDPVSVSVLEPAPVAVSALVKVSVFVPDMSKVTPPVVLLRFRTRSVLWPVPVYCRVTAVVPPPSAMVPFAIVVGAPRALLPPPTLAMLLKASVP